MAKQALNLGTVADDGTGDTLRAGGTKLNANFDELYKDAFWVKRDFGAVGNNSTDDTTAVQNALNAAAAAGTANSSAPIVVFESGYYKITSTLSWPIGVKLIAQGGRGDLPSALTTLSWGGADGGLLMQLDAGAAANIPYTSAENLTLSGNMPTNGTVATGADSCLRIYSSSAANARPDTGFYFRNCQFGRCRADAVRFESQGILNFHATDCRWDNINGFAIKLDHGLGGGTINIDRWTYSNGATGSTVGKGFFHLDATSANVGYGPYYIQMSNAKIEVNASFNSLFNALVYLTARSPLGSNVVMAHIVFDSVWSASPSATPGSHAWVKQSVTAEDRLFTATWINCALARAESKLVENTTTVMPYDGDATKTKILPLAVFAPWFADTNGGSSWVPLMGRVLAQIMTIGTAFGAPTITSGTGAPSAAEPNGSIYLRTDGASATTLYVRAAGAWVAK